jgi:phage head maturation protease
MDKKYLLAKVLVDEKTGKKIFVASDESLDRHGEVISIDAWDIENFKKNPVILWGHDQSHPAIGIAEKIGYKTVADKKSLVFEPIFHKKDEISRVVGELVNEGWITASSVGFLINEMVENTITKAELLEISFVNVPANPNALQLMRSNGLDNETIKQIMPDMEKAEKELEIETLRNEVNDLKSEIKSLSEARPRNGINGREPARADRKEEVARRTAIKVLNRAVELLNRVENERK